MKEAVRHILVITGPSGVGKTTLASTIVDRSEQFTILRTTTTRSPRPSDDPDTFAHVTDQSFLKSHTEREFFLCRLEPRPRYGYKAADFASALQAAAKIILMLRPGAMLYLAEQHLPVQTVFLEAEPETTVQRSRNIFSPTDASEAAELIAANRRLQELFAQRDWPFLRFTNRYQGLDELSALAEGVIDFVNQNANESPSAS